MYGPFGLTSIVTSAMRSSFFIRNVMAQAEAEADAAELRHAEAAQQGRGRWARLRAAWQGG